jgi:hypothetical protein
MSDEASKKAGTRPASATLDRLKAELSAGLKTGEDPLYYDWTRVAEAPQSEAAYVPPMQIHTQAMDTGDLAAIIGRDAAEAARHAPAPEQKVMIGEPGADSDQTIDVDFGDAIPTEEMHDGPVSDDRLAVKRRLAAVGGHRSRSGWMWIACAIAAVLGCAAFMWTQRGDDGVKPGDSAASSNTSAAKPVTRTTIPPEPPAPALAASTASTTAVAVPDPPAAPVTPPPASGISPRKANAVPVPPPEQAPSRRQPTPPRRPSTPQPTQQKPAGNEVDPLFTEKPGY